MSDQPPFQPPAEPRFDPPSGPTMHPPAEPLVHVSPIAPKSNPWKPAALGFGAAAVLGAGILGVMALTDDDEAASPGDVPTVTVPPALQEQIDAANARANDVLASIPEIPGMPSVPQGEPSDSPTGPTTPATEPNRADETEGDVTISIPEAAELEAISECLGFGDLLGELDLGELGLGERDQLGTLPMGSLPNFAELTPEELAELDVAELLELMFGQMSSDLPAGSLPFDLSILEELDLGELGDAGALTPEQLEQLIESQLGDLGSLPSMPSMPEMPEMPEMPVIPGLDPAQLEECLADMMPAG